MIKRIIEKITDWLIKYDAIKEEEKDIYGYAVISIFLFISPFLLAIVVGLLMGCIKQSIVIVLPFVAIRRFSGGFHAKHLLACLLFSSLLLLLCIRLSFYFRFGWQIVLLTLISAVSIIIFSPIDNDNRLLNQNEIYLFKKTTVIMVIVFLLVGVFLIVNKIYVYTVCLCIGIMLTASLQLPCIIKRFIKRKPNLSKKCHLVLCRLKKKVENT